jgi:uncharacterized protein (UPF0262 family)
LATPDPRIADLQLDERTVVWRSADIEHERRVAIFDLLEASYFAPAGHQGGPYRVLLSISENRLVFDISDHDNTPVRKLILGLASFKRLIKDYFAICESYFQAIKTKSPSQIEAIDMGRRGVHDEGSQILRQRLKGKVDIDMDTARRLFTLICVLHFRG